MRQSKSKRVRRGRGGLTLLTVLGIGGVAFLLAAWNAHAPQNGGLTPAEVVAMRFPDSRYDAFDDVGDARAEATTADGADTQSFSLFTPYATLPQQAVVPLMPAGLVRSPTAVPQGLAAQPSVATPQPPAAQSPAPGAPAARPPAKPYSPYYQTASLASTPVELAARTESPAPDVRAKAAPKIDGKPAAAHAKPAPRPDVKRPGAVLSERQIASIKTRLNLTPDQQDMWPAVEQALRSLSYTKKPAEELQVASAARAAEIDPYSDEVQRLKSAAFPLIMSFSDEQKRELRILAHVAGLEKLATQF